MVKNHNVPNNSRHRFAAINQTLSTTVGRIALEQPGGFDCRLLQIREASLIGYRMRLSKPTKFITALHARQFYNPNSFDFFEF